MKLRRNDFILILTLLLIGAGLFSLQYFLREQGGVAAVYVNGEKIEEYSLQENITVTLTSGEEGYNVLHVEDGKAWISEASCPDKICVNTGKIQYSGQSITCLPNKTQVVIEGGVDNGIDIG